MNRTSDTENTIRKVQIKDGKNTRFGVYLQKQLLYKNARLGVKLHKYCCTKGNVRIKYEQRMQFGVYFQIPETMWVWGI